MDASSSRLLQNIFCSHEPSLRARRLPLKHLKALDAIVSCRTPDRGTSLFSCEAEQKTVALHHACKHRSCWQCAQREKVAWVEAQQERLIDCAHFHVVFTLPQEYRVLWQYNTAWFTRTFLKVVNTTLRQLMMDQKHHGVGRCQPVTDSYFAVNVIFCLTAGMVGKLTAALAPCSASSSGV